MWMVDYLWGFMILAAVIGLIFGMVIEAMTQFILGHLEHLWREERGRWHFKN